MNDYVGKICPYCKTEFRPGDDIVVCSACDMPHHKDCWVENQGCTTFGCLGTIQAADPSPSSSVTATQMQFNSGESVAAPVDNGFVFCTRCGAQNASSHSFCARCGNRLVSASQGVPQAPAPAPVSPSYSFQQAAPSQQQGDPTGGYNAYPSGRTADIDGDVQRLVGTNTEYYIPKFRQLKAEGRAASWNWPAFLVTPYWLLYRKLYGYAVAVLATEIILSLIGSTFLYLLAFCGYVAFGVLGNGIYLKYLENMALQAKDMNEPYKSQFIASNGGVNMTVMILALIGRVILAGILVG